MADQLFLVPIRMDALYLDQDALMAEPSVDFARLPFFNGQRDVNPDVANISENFVAPPLQNQNQLYPKGLHLHWALPDALTKGKRVARDERSTVEFPAVPDRWLIQRTGGGLPARQWVVESNFLWPEEGQLNQIVQIERQINRYQEATLLSLHQFLEEVWGIARSLERNVEEAGGSISSSYKGLISDLSDVAAYTSLDGLPPDENKNPKLLQSVQTERESFERMRQAGLLLQQSRPTVADLVFDFLADINSALQADTISDAAVTAIRSGLGTASQSVDDIKQNFILFKETELFPFTETLARVVAELAVLTISSAEGYQSLYDATLAKLGELEQSLGAPAFTDAVAAQEATTSLSTIQGLLRQYLDQHSAASSFFQPLAAFLELPANDNELSQDDLQSLHDGLNDVHVLLALVYGYLPFFQADLQSQLEAQYIQLGLLQDRLQDKEEDLAAFDGSASSGGDNGEGDGNSGDDSSGGTDLSGLIAQKETELQAKVDERDGTTEPPVTGLVADIATKQTELDTAEEELIPLEQELFKQQEELREKETQHSDLTVDQNALDVSAPTQNEAELNASLSVKEEELNGPDGESGKNKELTQKETELEGIEKQIEDLQGRITEAEDSIQISDDPPNTIADNIIAQMPDEATKLKAQDKLKAYYDVLAGTPQGTGSLSDLVILEKELNQLNLEYQQNAEEATLVAIGEKEAQISTKQTEIDALDNALLELSGVLAEGETTSPARDYITAVLPNWKDITRSIIALYLEKADLEASVPVVEGELAGLQSQVNTLEDDIATLNKQIIFLQLQTEIDVLDAAILSLVGPNGTDGSIAAQEALVADKIAEISGGLKSDGTNVTGLEADLESLDQALEVLQGDINKLEREIQQLENEQAIIDQNPAGTTVSSTAADLELELKLAIAELEEAIDFQEKTISQTARRSFEDYANKRKFSITMPMANAWDTSGQQVFRYMGRSLSLEQFLARPQIGQAFFHPLTALGYGEPSFAAFYPNCRSVFGFHDADINEELSSSVNYSVVGWYSQPDHDYLRQLVANNEENPLYQLAAQARWLQPVALTLTELNAQLPDSSEGRAIWDLLRTNNWLQDTTNTDEAIILIQDGLPDFPDEILTRPGLVEQILQDHLAARLPADFPREMICAAQLEFQAIEPGDVLLKSDFSNRIATMLSERGTTVSHLDDSINAIWGELELANWIEIGTNSSEGRLVAREDRVPRFLDLDVTEPISQAMVEEALRAEPTTPISVTIANNSREAIAARLVQDVIPTDVAKVKELRLIEAEIKDVKVQIESLLRRKEKIGLTTDEESTLSTLSNQRDTKQSQRDDLQDELDMEEATNRAERLLVEDQLEALFLTDQLSQQQLDIGPKFAEARHEAGFDASSGGGQWMVRLERTGDQNAQEVTEAERNRAPLDETVATALSMLNDAQQRYDQAQFLIESQRQQLFTDWYKYMMSTYPPQDSLVDFPDIDEVRYFIQEKDLRPLWELLVDTGQLLLDDPTRPYAASSALGIDRDDQLSKALLREIDALDATPEESVRDFLLEFTDRRELFTLLNKEEITDWTGLVSLLQAPGDSASTQQVFDALPTEVQQRVRLADPATVSDEDKNLIVQGLSDLLMLSTQTADALNILQLQLQQANIELSLLTKDDIKDWSAFFNAMTSPEPASLLGLLRESLSQSIQDQIDAQHQVRSAVITVFNAILASPPDAGRFTAVLDSLRQYGSPGLVLLQFTEQQVDNWEEVFTDLEDPAPDSPEASLMAQLPQSITDAINDPAQSAADLAATEIARLRILKGLRLMLWQQNSSHAVHALTLLSRWLAADQLIDDLSPRDIRDWAGLLYELKYKQSNTEIADLWAALPADVQTLLTDNEVEDVLIDEAEKQEVIDGINAQLQALDFRSDEEKAAATIPLEEIIATNRNNLELELGASLRPSLKGSYRLQRQSSPRYWTAKEPSVLVTGDLAIQSDRFGKDGQANSGLLECYLVPGEPVEGLLSETAELEDLLAAISTHTAAQKRIAGQTNPWNPFLLEWEVESCPIQYGGNSRDQDYTAKFILDNTELAVNQVDLTTTTDQFLEGNNPDIYNGRSLLTPEAATVRDLESRIQAYLSNAASADTFKPHAETAQASLAALKGQMLAQSLSGINPALLMLRQSYQMPVMDPIGFREYQDFTYLVSRLVGIATKQSPQPLTDFNPIRTGKLRINQLRLVDSFGQYRQLDLYGSRHGAQLLGSSLGATQVDGLDNRALIDLPPRLVQPTRLSFRWLAAENLVQEEAETEMNNLPDTSPICGWVMANHLDGSLMVFDAQGRSLGAIENEADGSLAKWTPAPGLEGLDNPDDIDNVHLHRMVSYLINRGAVFIEQFLENTHKVLQSIEPETFAQQQALALLMGRPMALVRANLDLELYGVPAVNHSWEAFYRDRLDGDEDRETDQYTRVRFPIRIGAVAQLNDGLVGYWVEDETGRYDNDLFYINLQQVDPDVTDLEAWMLPDTAIIDEHFSLLQDGYTPISQSLSPEEPAVTVSMLMDPRAKVHAFTGIVPAKNISIPSEHYLTALQAIDITFLTAPVLTTAKKIQLPLQDQPGFAWSWLEQLKPDNWREVHTYPTLGKELFVETFSQQVWAYLLQRKWVSANENESGFIMNPLADRNPLSTNFAVLQDKIKIAFPDPPADAASPEVPVSLDDLRPLILSLWEDVLIQPTVNWLKGAADDEVASIVPMEGRVSSVFLAEDENGIRTDFQGLETRVAELLVRLQTSVQSPVTDAAFFTEQLWLREGWLQLKRME